MTVPPVEARLGWVTPTRARATWPGAPRDDVTLTELLLAAYEACTAYAPGLAVPDPEPAGYEPPYRCGQAQVLMARAVWTAARARADGLGLDDMTGVISSVQPTLTGQVKQLLRPAAGIPAIG